MANLLVALGTSLGMNAQKDKAMEPPVLYRTAKVDGLNIFCREHVDARPAGATPFGVMDVVGNVWHIWKKMSPLRRSNCRSQPTISSPP
jgi:hypothetical protein